MKEIIILSIAILLALYNGQFINNKTKAWHRTGFIIRALIMVLLWPNWILMLVYFNLAWTVYDIIINVFYLKVPWWYQGETGWIDSNISPDVIFPLKFFLLLTTTVYVLHYNQIIPG